MTEAVAGGADVSKLRELNSLSIVRAMRGRRPATVTELATRTGLSRPGTDVVVRGLVTDGWVKVVEPDGSSVGRPARRYRFNAGAGHVLGVDVGGHKILVLLADLDGTVLHRHRLPVASDADPAARLEAVDLAITQCLSAAGMRPEEIWAVTVGVTGPVDATGRTTLFTPLPGWASVSPAEHLADRFTCPILVENDCKLAAVAERWQGAAQDADDIVYLLAGMRTGAGLIIDGTLRRGFGGAAGEIGALKAVRWLSAPAHIENCPGVPEDIHPDDKAAWVFERVREGDRDAKAALRRYVKDLAVGAAALVLTLDPQVVVLGGGYSRSADLIIDPLTRELTRLCLRVPEIRASNLGADSVALGALRVALDQIDARLFGDGMPAPLALS
ncbi:putative NBD/HSP70 family sugar kinase [Actinocorallia herbida]|uniref:Putative NBD/HSP70 family sugar kinase n=1 Tax=Actinocorallia herbida TaxID=58109 RepID=A0A3N1D0C4_9ACTN|nr:ROK family protein [Actinocorallia herbida]ROO86970.1 putative NBD/HSP70 family sugar kinase [Actinocorallia herbida]